MDKRTEKQLPANAMETAMRERPIRGLILSPQTCRKWDSHVNMILINTQNISGSFFESYVKLQSKMKLYTYCDAPKVLMQTVSWAVL